MVGRDWEEEVPPEHDKETGEEVYLFDRELLSAGATGDEGNVAAGDAEVVKLARGQTRQLGDGVLVSPPVAVLACK